MKRFHFAHVVAIAFFALLAPAALADAPSSDVTAKVAAAVKDGALSITVSNSLFGATASGRNKELRLVYAVGADRHTRTYPENAHVVIAPPTGEKLEIVKATYGDLAAPVLDVTDKIASAVKDNAVDFAVSPAAVGVDPAPDKTKQLRVTYSFGSLTGTAAVDDGDTLQIPAPANGKKLVIVEAEYGLPDPRADVTEKVAGAVRDNKLAIDATNDEFGDPAPGTPKQLRVDYSVGNVLRSATVNENQTLRLPAAGDPAGPLSIRQAIYGVLP